jgi:hypothetical protein
MTTMKEKWLNILILCILALGVWMRVSLYGDLRLSVGNAETPSYIESSRAPLFSWDIFAGKRLFTTNLIFKMANNESECPLAPVSSPVDGVENYREIQPCFDNIVLLQNILAALGWCCLAWSISRFLGNPLLKISSAILILAFAFTPQIAEWDSILSPESLTFSLLAISFAVLQEITFRVSKEPDQINGRGTSLLIAGWLIVFALWVFIRDVNLYAIPITIVLLAPLILVKKFRHAKILTITITVLIGLFILGYISAKDSLRATHYALAHAFDAYIVPYPDRVEFFTARGMPDHESPEFQGWFDANATRTYATFMLSHPGFVVTTIWEQIAYFRSDFEQPYYKVPANNYRKNLFIAGEFVHPESMAVYLIDALLFVFLCVKALKYRDKYFYAWMWLAGWYLLCATVILLASFFGDTAGTRRHIFPSVEMFRLFLWIFLMPYLDLPGADRQTSTQQQSL